MNILVLAHPGGVSRNILLDMARGVEAAGHRVFTAELGPVWEACQSNGALAPRITGEFSAQVRSFIKAKGIDACIAMWGNAMLSLTHAAGAGGHVEPFFEAVGCPHVQFWLDAPQWAHGGTFVQHCRTPIVSSPALIHVVNNAETAREMTGVMGFGRVVARSYGVCERTFRPRHGGEGVAKEFDLLFASGPGFPAPTGAALQELESDEPDMMRLRRGAADVALRSAGELGARAGERGRAVEEVYRALVEAQVKDRDEPMLDRLARLRGAGLDTGALTADHRLFIDATALVRSVEQFERAFTVAYLARRFKLAMIGEGDLSAWGSPITRLGDVPHEEQARAYARARVGLNVMRWQDDAGLNLKCFEITACGVPCLVGRRRGLDSLFDPAREVLAFDSPGRAARVLRDALESSERLATVARAGRERTLRDHTWAQWAGDILAAVR